MSTLQKLLKIHSIFFLINQLINQSIKCFQNGSSAVNKLFNPSFILQTLLSSYTLIFASIWFLCQLTLKNVKPFVFCSNTILNIAFHGYFLDLSKYADTEKTILDLWHGNSFCCTLTLMVEGALIVPTLFSNGNISMKKES